MKNKEYIIKLLSKLIKEVNEIAPIDLTPENIVVDLEDIKEIIEKNF